MKKRQKELKNDMTELLCIHINLQFSSVSMLVNVKLYISEYKKNTC